MVELNLDVKALGVIPRTSSKNETGENDVDLEIDDLTIRPGSYVWVDDDGVLFEL